MNTLRNAPYSKYNLTQKDLDTYQAGYQAPSQEVWNKMTLAEKEQQQKKYLGWEWTATRISVAERLK